MNKATSPSKSAPPISEREHQDAEANIRFYSYKKPAEFDRKKVSVLLGKSDYVRGMIQVVTEGGENNLHYHSNVDAFWMVMKGKAKFYGPNDEMLGEVGEKEGLVIPRNARYWFESSSEEELEVLLVQAFCDPAIKNSGRTDSAPRKLADAGASPHLSAEV